MTGFPANWAATFSATKSQLVHSSGMSEDLLHVHVGLLIFVVGSLLWRRKRKSLGPLYLVAFLALANEVLDWLASWPQPVAESVLDIVNTVFWPVVLTMLLRAR